MPEQFSNKTQESPIEKQKREIIELARALSGGQETFSFPGIAPEFYSNMKAEELAYPGFATPIDDLLERFKNEGFKIVLGEHPESGNVFVLPAQSDDIENDSVLLSRLQDVGVTDARLRKLIQLKRG